MTRLAIQGLIKSNLITFTFTYMRRSGKVGTRGRDGARRTGRSKSAGKLRFLISFSSLSLYLLSCSREMPLKVAPDITRQMTQCARQPLRPSHAISASFRHLSTPLTFPSRKIIFELNIALSLDALPLPPPQVAVGVSTDTLLSDLSALIPLLTSSLLHLPRGSLSASPPSITPV